MEIYINIPADSLVTGGELTRNLIVSDMKYSSSGLKSGFRLLISVSTSSIVFYVVHLMLYMYFRFK